MTTPQPAKGTSDILGAEFWTAQKWFMCIVLVLAFWTALYVFTHTQANWSGYEYASLNTAQVKQVNKILNPNAAVARQTSSGYIDSGASINYSETPVAIQNMDDCGSNCRIDKALLYLNKEYDNRIGQSEQDALRKYISTFGLQDVGLYLVDYKIKVGSFFWLTGPMVYLEIIFWTMIGVLSSILFSIGSVLRRPDADAFNRKEIVYQVAKMFYAPFSAIIIVLAYSYFRHNITLNIEASSGIIVFAFIAGLYSGRFMNFLNRIKQAVLPTGTLKPDAYQVNYGVPYFAGPVAAPQNTVPTADSTTNSKPENEVVEAVKPASEKDIKEVDIDLRLDARGMMDEEKDILQQLGFNKAIVTLHNVNGRDIIPAKRVSNTGPATFIATDVKPGIYIARATLSQKLKDDQVVNLFGERTAYVTIDKPGLELYVRKYDTVD